MFILPEKKIKVLAIGAHPDDIEFGAGGFLLKLLNDFNATIHMSIMTYGTYSKEKDKKFNEKKRAKEALVATKKLLNVSTEKKAKKHLHFGGFKDCELYNAGHGLIRKIEDLLDLIKPSIVLTHAYGDFHDDHRQVHQATLSATRNYHGTILFYQAPSTIPNEFCPTFFVHLSNSELKKKISLLKTHSSQKNKRYMSSSHSTKIAESWAEFHRMSEKTKLEAFVLFKSFFK